MTTSHIQRGDLSKLILEEFNTLGVIAGRGLPPDNVGWTASPNVSGSVYVPYSVFIPGAATVATGSFVDAQLDWQLPYVLLSYGISAEQCESQADEARKVIIGMNKRSVILGLEGWKIYSTQVRNLGQVVRNDSFTPPEFSQQDVVSIWISKEFT